MMGKLDKIAMIPAFHTLCRCFWFLWRWLGEILVFAAIVAVLGWPALATALQAVGDAMSGASMAGVVGMRLVRLAIETIKLVALTESIALPLGVLIGFLVFRTNAWGRRPLLAVIGVSLFVRAGRFRWF